MNRFFDDFPRFYKTSMTGSDAEWNNRRYKVLIDGCLHVIVGRHVFDFGSHDGRWAFAALTAGAEHVTCIEPEPDLLEATEQNFREYGIDPRRYTLVNCGAMDFLQQCDSYAETAFLFGMLTLISEQPVLFRLLRDRGIKNVIIDTHIVPGETRTVFQLFRAAVQRGNAITPDRTHHNGWMMGLTPSLTALTSMLEHFEWQSTILDWTELQQHPDMNDYAIGRRVSILAQ